MDLSPMNGYGTIPGTPLPSIVRCGGTDNDRASVLICRIFRTWY